MQISRGKRFNVFRNKKDVMGPKYRVKNIFRFIFLNKVNVIKTATAAGKNDSGRYSNFTDP